MERKLEKARGIKPDANRIEDVIAATEGMDLLINGLPPDVNMNLMKAALRNKVNYQDMASFPV